jgi:hypothetical protein
VSKSPKEQIRGRDRAAPPGAGTASTTRRATERRAVACWPGHRLDLVPQPRGRHGVRQLRRAQKEKAPGRGAVDMLKTRTLGA